MYGENVKLKEHKREIFPFDSITIEAYGVSNFVFSKKETRERVL
jgi:hypothetical protein